MKKKIIAVVVLLLVVASALMLLKTRKANLAQAPVAAVLPVVVEAITLQPQEVTLTLPAMGIVSSNRSTLLSTKLSGRITRVLKQEGEPVRAGELIATIDAAELQARRQALLAKENGLETSIAFERQSHQRTLELFAVGGAALEQKQKEEAAIIRLVQERESLLQNIREVEELLSYARILAPVAGTLSERLVGVGDLAVPGKPLFKIAASEGLFLDLSLPSEVLANNILYREQILPLSAKNQAGASALREYRAPLPLGTTLVEGEFINVSVVLFSGNEILLPNDVLLTLQGTTYVLVYQDGKVEKTPVSVTRRGSQGVMTEEDLSGKTLLLAKPDILLRATSGAPVHILHQEKDHV